MDVIDEREQIPFIVNTFRAGILPEEISMSGKSLIDCSSVRAQENCDLSAHQ
jgi:hypothetical protein